jgi:hypothetical protein
MAVQHLQSIFCGTQNVYEKLGLCTDGIATYSTFSSQNTLTAYSLYATVYRMSARLFSI